MATPWNCQVSLEQLVMLCFGATHRCQRNREWRLCIYAIETYTHRREKSRPESKPLSLVGAKQSGLQGFFGAFLSSCGGGLVRVWTEHKQAEDEEGETWREERAKVARTVEDFANIPKFSFLFLKKRIPYLHIISKSIPPPRWDFFIRTISKLYPVLSEFCVTPNTG